MRDVRVPTYDEDVRACVCQTVLSDMLAKSPSFWSFLAQLVFSHYFLLGVTVLNLLSLLLAVFTLRVQYQHVSANITVNEVRLWACSDRVRCVC